MTAAELLALLAICDSHLPRAHTLTQAVEQAWREARDTEPPKEEGDAPNVLVQDR